MSVANLYFLPEITLLAALLIIVSICFLKFSSLRRYRRKRNLLIYTFLALMLGSLAYKTYDDSLGIAIVSYSLESEKPFYADRINPLEVSVENLGQRETSFYIVLTATNASLMAESQEYIQLNSSAIKIPFNFHGVVHERITVTVPFRMDENVTGCIFYPTLEPINNLPIVTCSTAWAESVWNNRTGRYTLNPIMGPCV